VVCGFADVMATLRLSSALSRVDFPTFGLPLIETNPER
jgi:hypothetical protein